MNILGQLIKEASDADEAIDLAAELTDQGYMSDYDFYKLASAYDEGYLDAYYAQQDTADFMLDKIAAKATPKKGKGKKVVTPEGNFITRNARKFGGYVKGKWNAASPLTKKILKGTGIGAGLATVGGAGYLIGNRNRD